MSTIVTSNVSDGTLSIPTTYVTNGSAKAWVNFNGTGTIAARDSFNVTSLTDNGTGDYSVNFTNAMANANYAMSGAAGDDGQIFSYRAFGSFPPTANYTRLALRGNDGSSLDGTAAASISGDLA